MNYYVALQATSSESLPADAIIVSEGANTMDIGRTILLNREPRTRLDAGSYGTMGVGLGFAVAASVANPGKRIVAVEGDAAFGFSGMELETMCRYRLPITVVVINNNGIGGGVSELRPDRDPPPSVMLPGARYEKVIDAFGGQRLLRRRPGGPGGDAPGGEHGRRPRDREHRDRAAREPQAAAVRLAHGPNVAG